MSERKRSLRGRKKMTEEDIAESLRSDMEDLMEEFNHLQGKFETMIQRMGYFNRTRRGTSTETIRTLYSHETGQDRVETNKPI